MIKCKEYILQKYVDMDIHESVRGDSKQQPNRFTGNQSDI